MTIEQSKREPRSRISPLELRLYIAALLAVVYTLSWRAIGGHAGPVEPTRAAPSATRDPQQRFVWLDSLPPAVRPAIALPAGWQLASDPQPSPTLPPRVVRAPSKRVPRVRTRSS